MRVKTPVGEYDYRVTGVRLRRAGLELDGSMGVWETSMVVEPKDLAKAGAAVAAVALALRALRSRGGS